MRRVPPWDVPNWRISTEVGARADFDDEWWSAGGNANRDEFARYFFDDDGPPSQTYEAFVEDWLEDVNGQWGGDREAVVASVFSAFADAEFVGLCWSALQWDQGTFENPSHFLIEALRADGVRSPLMFNQGNGANRYTPLKDDYVTAGGTYRITDFAPHAYGCDESEVCPGCQQ